MRCGGIDFMCDMVLDVTDALMCCDVIDSRISCDMTHSPRFFAMTWDVLLWSDMTSSWVCCDGIDVMCDMVLDVVTWFIFEYTVTIHRNVLLSSDRTSSWFHWRAWVLAMVSQRLKFSMVTMACKLCYIYTYLCTYVCVCVDVYIHSARNLVWILWRASCDIYVYIFWYICLCVRICIHI